MYNRARWLDVDLGRFISVDPLGFDAGDVNLRRYVGNGPASAVDPSGMLEKQVGMPQPKPNVGVRPVRGPNRFPFAPIQDAVDRMREQQEGREAFEAFLLEGRLATQRGMVQVRERLANEQYLKAEFPRLDAETIAAFEFKYGSHVLKPQVKQVLSTINNSMDRPLTKDELADLAGWHLEGGISEGEMLHYFGLQGLQALQLARLRSMAEKAASQQKPWESLPLRSNSYGNAEGAAGTYVNQRLLLCRHTPDGPYKFVLDVEGRLWLAPAAVGVKQSSLVPRSDQVRAAGYIYVLGGRANPNGHSGHYMADEPVLGGQIQLYQQAVGSTVRLHGIDPIVIESGTSGGPIRPPK